MKTVIIADIIGSKKYNDRYKSQIFLKEVLKALNEIYKEDIIFSVEIRSGDEIQGLFTKSESAYSFYRILKLMIYPMKIRSGFSVGETFEFQANKSWNSNEIDGPVYHLAREALNKCKDKKINALFHTKNSNDKYLNTLLMASDEIIKGMSISVNITQILCELLFPLSINKKENHKILNLKEDLITLITLKYEVYLEEIERHDFYKSITKNLHKERELIKINYEILLKYITELNYTFSDEDKINPFWQKGFSTKIAEIVGIQRQTIDRHLNLYSNYGNLRNIEGTILLFLNEYYGGK